MTRKLSDLILDKDLLPDYRTVCGALHDTEVLVDHLERILLDTISKLRYRGEHLFADEIESRLKTVLGEK